MEITFFIETPIALHTALPYIAEFRRKNVNLHFVIDQRLIDASEVIFHDAVSMISIDDLDHSHRFIKTLHNLLRITFTDSQFSPIYQRWLKQRLKGKNLAAILFLTGLSNWGPKWQSDKINRNLTLWLRRILPNPFPTSRLVYVTNTSRPYLLCARGLKVYTIIESWDHPGKAPIGHISEKVFVWNQSLLHDWQKFQGDAAIGIAYPVKLNYAISANKLKKDEILEPDNKRIMYPATFGSSSDPRCYSEELRLMEALCRATQSSGYKLLLKPKPNSTPGELDSFLKFPHVEIGQYQNNRGGSNYNLSDVYNKQRLYELSKSDVIVNLGTTFAFDAAAFGLPVIQLKFLSPKPFPALSELSTFPHLSQHLYSRKESIFVITDAAPLEERIQALLEQKQYLKKAREFSLHLREWMIPNHSLQDAVESVVRSCLE